MDIKSFRTPGLGDSTYVLTHDGVGILVDPQRDVDRFLDTLEDHGIELGYVLETHLHNDYLSGGREAAARTGARLVLPASSGAAFRHVPAFHMEDLEHDAFVIRPIHTPGHTPEHTSYLVIVDGLPVALFSGGSLLVGSAGRPDLLGMAQADTLARLQFSSVNRLAQLGDDVGLYPTHGEGSFCTASGAGQYTSTIGAERASNPVLNYPDENSFVEGQMAGLQPYPTYYAHMGPGNLFGPEPLPRLHPPALDPGQVRRMQDEGYRVIDARSKDAFIDGHIPGSLGVELRDDFGTWVGWLEEYNAPMVLVLDEGQDAGEAIVQLNRIGFDRIEGIMWGLADWMLQGFPLDHLIPASAPDVAAAACRGEQVLDVRSPAEWHAGHLEGSTHVYVPEMIGAIPEVIDPDRPAWIMCGSGYRAAIAGGLLRRHGMAVRVFAAGGVEDVQRAGEASDIPCDLPLLVTS